MRKFKKGDLVAVIAGGDKGKRGTILRMVGKKKVVVEGVRLIKKHVKPNPQQQQQGGIIEREAPLDMSNIAHIDPGNDQIARVGFKSLEDGRKVRFYKKSNELVDA